MKLVIQIILFVSFISLFAQKKDNIEKIRASGNSLIEFPSSKSKDEIQKEAREKAIINALQKAFGEVVFRDNKTMVKNITTGNVAETKTHFEMHGNTIVKGRLLEVISEHFEEVTSEIDIDGRKFSVSLMQCNVEIWAAPVSEPKFDIQSYPVLNGTRKTYEFNSMEELNLFFKSPVSGYVSVYYHDILKEKVFRILPEKTDDMNYETGFPILPDRNYIFFEKAGYKLYTEELLSSDRMYVIFSQTPNVKPSLELLDSVSILDKQYVDKGYTLPIGLSQDKFHKWLNDTRYRSNDMYVEYININIKK
jgi:hypothetical protein